MHFGGLWRLPHQHPSAAITLHPAIFDQIITIPGAEGDAKRVVAKAAIAHRDVVGPNAKEKTAAPIARARTALEQHIGTARAGIQPIARIFVEGAVDDFHIPTHLKTQTLAKKIPFADTGNFNPATIAKIHRAAPTPAHRLLVGGSIPL